MPFNHSDAWLGEQAGAYHKKDMLQSGKDTVRRLVNAALKKAVDKELLPDAPAPEFVVETPADPAHGDAAVNVAMVGAKTYKMAPRQIAEAVVSCLDDDEMVGKVEVAGPGFINLYYADAWFESVVKAACSTGEDYGKTNTGGGEKINVEFVSANPTGPMHLGNARGGALGDCLAEAMLWAGYDVTREFYINDTGNQIIRFGESLAARYKQLIHGEDAVKFPEDGYQGGDIKERAKEFYDLEGDAPLQWDDAKLAQALIDYALPKNIAAMKADLEKYRIEYDVWFHESTLHESGEVDSAVKELLKDGEAYEEDGAIWYKATAHGAEKDEVLVRANGIPTYFAADIAYHKNKFNRGFSRAIDVWGADHHGHVARMKGAMDAAGYDGDKLDIVLMQFVRLVQDGEAVRMSKRTGEAITLTDLLDEVPIDSARFFFNMREPGSQIEFDLDLAVAEDSENPVYYVQYAHARICSLFEAMAQDGVAFDAQRAFESLHLLQAPQERELIRLVASFPSDIVFAAENYDPARVTRSLMEHANSFHKFYTACRIKGQQEGLLQARLALCLATKNVLSNGLKMLKVSAPEGM